MSADYEGINNRYKVDVPEGSIGDWEIKRFRVSKEDADLFNFSESARCERYVTVGRYTKLSQGDQLVMSDTPYEIYDFREFCWRAHGRILLNGFGLGCLAQALLNKQGVEHVTAIEMSPEVIELVSGHYQRKFGSRLTIIEGDALTYKFPPSTKFDAVFHDIWTTISTENHEEMKRLHRRYGRKASYQESWCRGLIERHIKEDRIHSGSYW